MAREGAKVIEINHLHEMYVSCALSRGSPSKLTRTPFDFLGIVLGNSILKKKKSFGLFLDYTVSSITVDFQNQCNVILIPLL